MSENEIYPATEKFIYLRYLKSEIFVSAVNNKVRLFLLFYKGDNG